MIKTKLLGVLLSLACIASSHQEGVIEVLHSSPEYQTHLVALITFLTVITSITFVAILVICGLRKPLA